MSRVKILFVIALVSIMAFPVGLAQAQQAVPTSADETFGTVVIWDDAALSDAVTYSLTGIAAPAAGTVLVGWLVSDDGATKLNTGALTVAADGTVSHTFDSNSAGYTGENLIAAYDKVVITSEAEANAAAASPAGTAVYNHVIPAAGLAHIRHLLTSWPEGSETGILTDLKSQLDAAIAHANLAKDSATLEDVLTHTHHVINILEGATGANYDIAFGDPGDGVGAINYAIDRKHGPFAAAAVPDDEVIAAGAALVDITGKNAEDWATEARDIALNSVVPAGSLALAQIFLGPGAGSVISALDAARNGYDSNGDGTIASVAGEGGTQQAYVEAQRTATFTLTGGAPGEVEVPPPDATPTPTPTPAPTTTPSEPGIGLPSVGDSSIPLLAQIALIASLVVLSTGGIILVRTRRPSTRA